MDVEQFETMALNVSLFALFGLMFFIVFDLAKKSKAGKFGTFVLFLGLCLGMLGFMMKGVIASALGL